MQTPIQQTLEEFSLARMIWIRDHCHDEDGFQVCNKCSNKVELRGAYISIHDWRFGNHCCGSGRVIRLAIP